MSSNSTVSKPGKDRFGIEVRRATFDTTWRPLLVGGVQEAFKSRKQAEKDLAFCKDRNPHNEYRVVILPASHEATEAAVAQEEHPLPDAPTKAANWRNTLYLIRRGPGDHFDKFTEQYPVPAQWAQTVVNYAGTSDADWKVIEAAAGLLADLENWSIRAAHAMRHRKGIAFDTLANELSDMLKNMKPPAPEGMTADGWTAEQQMAADINGEIEG